MSLGHFEPEMIIKDTLIPGTRRNGEGDNAASFL